MKSSMITVFLSVSCIYYSASAQDGKLTFHSINMAGVSIGKSGSYGLFQTVNGLAYKKWFSGIGFGGDYYRYVSYPLFIDTRKYVGKNNKCFAYTDLGYNISGKNTPPKNLYYSSYDFSGGIFGDFGIGYRMKFTKKTSFLISGGYSYKEIQTKLVTTNPCLFGPCPVDYNNYKFGYGRVVLKAGVDF